MSDEKEEELGDFTRFPGPDYLPNKLPPMTNSECVEWARLNYRPGDPIPDSWWSVVRATCEEMNYEHRCRGYKKDYPPPKKIGKKPKKIDAFKEGARKIWDNKPLRRRWAITLGAALAVFGLGIVLIAKDLAPHKWSGGGRRYIASHEVVAFLRFVGLFLTTIGAGVIVFFLPKIEE